MSGENTQTTQGTEGQVQAPAEGQKTEAPAEQVPAQSDSKAVTEGTEGKVEDTTKEGDKTSEDAGKDATSAFDAGGDEALGQVYAVFTELGITPEVAAAAFSEAVKTNDVKKINKQALVDALGSETKANMAIAQATVYYNQRESAARHVEKLFNEVAGGDGKWEPVKNWVAAKASVDPAFKAETQDLMKMLGVSDSQTKFVAQELMRKFASDPHTKSEAAIEVGQKLDTSNNQLLSKAEFSKQFQEAAAKGDNATMNNLLARRRVSRAAGI